ncbi:NUDIX domain-containing protein [Clostridium massiliodielmoense]|uniref:NUDIX domain-containing protein n=1 Tax=Clostridium massiliodielmoense TaxID=1776385 RepID=UPI0001664A13|nr:NUDIX domain-containing protein [Clostridium massiliodielmoense]EDS76522.1 ADP-ribose pyrophosphatase [Clostridium botulinum C str. Eklund]NEZ49266.1 NUDIX domain-containing protein [Clostridium botulinum]
MSKYPEPTVGAIIFNPHGEILLCKSHKWGNKYVTPGGHIELGEKMEDALKREILEETGLKIYDIKLISLKESIYSDTFHEKKHFIFIDYICKTDSSNVILNDEAEEYEWVNLDKIDKYDLGGFIKELLLQLRNNKESKNSTKIFYNY